MYKISTYYNECNAELRHEDMVVNRPVVVYNELIKILTPLGTPVEFKNGQRIPTNIKSERVLYIITEGYASYRFFTSDNVITYVFSPVIIGFMGFFDTLDTAFYRAETQVKTIKVELKKIEPLLDKDPELWRSIAELINFAFQRLILRDIILSRKTSYEIIKNILMELSNQPEFVRKKVTAAQYILDRLPISRSQVMNLLSKLKSKKIIVTNRGCLVSISTFPDKL